MNHPQKGDIRMQTISDGPRPASAEIMEMADMLAAHAVNLQDRIYDKLQPVMSYKENTEKMMDDPVREYPPLFAELRDRLTSIERSLNNIEAMLPRVEL